MAKGQMRSNREAKKPKKAGVEKSKAGATSAYKQPVQSNFKLASKKG